MKLSGASGAMGFGASALKKSEGLGAKGLHSNLASRLGKTADKIQSSKATPAEQEKMMALIGLYLKELKLLEQQGVRPHSPDAQSLRKRIAEFCDSLEKTLAVGVTVL